jgi:hypothetical protein
MSSARSDDELLTVLRDLVRDNADKVFRVPGDQVSVEEVSLGRRLHENQTYNRHHRTLTVRYARPGERGEQRIWLKFLPRGRALFDTHAAVWEQTRGVCDIFPRPYFHGQWSGGGVIGMELVAGASLRSLFLRRALLRRRTALSAVFATFGRALRAFHDSSDPSRFASMGQLAENAREAAILSAHLSPHERDQVLASVAAAARAGGERTGVPLILVHHDCSLRNVLVRDTGSPCLVDLDAMPSTVRPRWYDVAVFLTNLESQTKYGPLGDAGSVTAAWRGFWTGYTQSGLPDDMSAGQVRAVLFLIKVEYVFNGPWLPVFDVYTGVLASRYLRRLKDSMLRGRCLTSAAVPL